MAQLSTSKQHILKNLDGVKDIKIRHATPEARRAGDSSKDGSAVDAGYDGSLSDEEARNERYGM
ncbi:MAG TPA: hypothetical protein ENH62_04515 [Marinobacter sp.]|uniref:Uncharacterized protein n=1 Tax=marine sediment metagenome TaxID=412755 RepID=A0A0F9PQV6_9ZZZZ|nr:hypothetical protein [Marinobacter sp.]